MQEQEEQNRHAERLNDTLFVLTTATTLFAPVQFLAGSSLRKFAVFAVRGGRAGGVYGMNFAVDGDPTIPELKLEYGIPAQVFKHAPMFVQRRYTRM